MSFWHRVGRQLQHPHGHTGQVVGHAMRLLNTKPNRLAIESLSIGLCDHVLELGFGPGQAISQMAKLAPLGKIYGVDASPAMLAQAMRRNRSAVAAGKVSLWLGEFTPLAMADSSLDKILAVNVVYFWQEATMVVAECRRVLRPGGKISIYATDASSMQRWKFAGQDTHTLYTADDLHDLLLQGGFAQNEISIETVMLPTGIKGILAVGQKSSASSQPSH